MNFGNENSKTKANMLILQRSVNRLIL